MFVKLWSPADSSRKKLLGRDTLQQ